MPNVTVHVTGGADKKSLQAITVGNRRWGVCGEAWGSTRDVPAGHEIAVVAYYWNMPFPVGEIDLENDVTIAVTANGPEDTSIKVMDV